MSAFKTTQNQSWSMFNDKLGNIPIKDCKKKDIFKSENPIELSDEDIPVFGLVPRLEKLTLVSCNKCSMIVKRDCIHHHYNRRHNNPENDNFSLERFILPIAKTNKHKKQKINIRKVPEKKITVSENSNSVVQGIQEIKTEFDQLEFEGIPEVTQVKVKQEIKVEYVDECNDNLAITNCIPSTSDVYDWTLKQCTQSIIHYSDHKANDRMTDCDKNLNKLSAVLPVDMEELQSNKCLADIKEEIAIDFVTNSRELSTSPDLNKVANSSIIIDFSGIMSDDEDYYEYNNKSKKLKKLPSVLQNNNEQTKLVSSNKYSDVNYEFLENITTFDQSSINLVDVKEQTKFALNNKYSNVVSDEDEKYKMSDNSQIYYHHLTSESLNNKEQTKFTPDYKHLDVTSNKNSIDSIISYYQSTASPNIKEDFKTVSNTKYSEVLNHEEENIKNNDNSKIVYYQLSPKVFKNKEQITFTPNCKYLNASSDKSFNDSAASYYQSSVVSLNINEEYKIMPNIAYSDVVNDEKENYKINDNSKIKYYQLSTELPNNETQTQFSPTNKYSEILGKKCSDNSVATIDNSSKLPFSIKKETKLSENNEYTVVMNNESSDDDVSSYDKSSISLLDIKEKSKPSLIVNYLNNDDCCYDTSNYEYYQISSGYNNETLIPLSPSYNKYLDIVVSDDEENDEIKNNYQLPSVLRNNDNETKDTLSNDYLDVLNNENSDNASTSYDHSQTVLLSKQEEKSKSGLLIDYLDVDNNGIVNSFENEYYQLSSELTNNEAQTSCTSSYKYLDVISNENSITSYDQSSNASLDLEDINLTQKDTYSDYISDSNDSDDSITSSNQSIIDSQDISKDTKYTQTCIFLNHMNHKQYSIDHTTNVDESIAESLSVVDDKTKYTQTDLPHECIDYYKITEDLIDNCIPIDSNVEIVDNLFNSNTPDSSCSTQIDEYSMNSFNPVNSSAQISGYPINSFTPISSSAQIINNIIIPTSAEVNDDFNRSISNSSNYLSCFQQLPWSPESQNDHFSNRSTHGPIIDNFRRHEDNDKMYGSEPYIDRPRQNENIFHRNIINGSTLYMDKNHITCRDRLKKTIEENIVNRKNCKSHTNNNIEAKIKKNLKRRMGGQVADGKENHNRWITGGFKKVKRVEFVVRKISYSDESDNNDNVDE